MILPLIDALALGSDGPEIVNEHTKAITKGDIEKRTRNARMYRVKMAMRLRDVKYRNLVYEKCARDPVYFINNFVWTVDPRVGDRKSGKSNRLPLYLFSHQVKLVRFLQKCNDEEVDGTIEKSRDQGFTSVCAAFAVWSWLFNADSQIGFGSRLERNVYKRGDDGAIFTKLAYIISSLPSWLKPAGYDEYKHYNEMIIVNPDNKSVIWGGSGDNMARGKRCQMFFADEHAFIPRADFIDGALSMVARCVIYGSTPNGSNSFFKSKVDNPAINHLRMHWKDDPRKDQAWYDHFCASHDKETVAREIDIDHNASVRGVAIAAKWIQAAIDVEIPNQELVTSRTIGGLDISVGGGDDMVLTIRRGPYVSIRVYEDPTPDFGATSDWVLENFDGDELYFDDDGVGATFGPAMAAKSPSFLAFPVNSGGRASDRIYGYDRFSKPIYGYSKFLNLKAELWALIRRYFINTFNYVESGIECDPNEMVKLQNVTQEDRKLVNQCSWYRFERASAGRTKMNDKKEFTHSPDFADSFCFTFMGDLETTMQGEYYGGVV